MSIKYDGLTRGCHTPDRLRRSTILSALGLATFSPARTVLFLGAHEATSQGVTHPGIAPASHSLNFGVPTTPKPVSSQKASCYEDARCAI
ncbi:cyclic nucleotide gated channel 1 [Prunus dulcis]|uniref:Cyclic nucleotide gated channel 1 n=1 Tax=Prunus dulcis TaxID=3755 RepID=A0A4Y1R671_PRUDU|nr:cyclic nucleotide gated channel 1 [Prunus dulcis]